MIENNNIDTLVMQAGSVEIISNIKVNEALMDTSKDKLQLRIIWKKTTIQTDHKPDISAEDTRML